jgi:glycosyltransferase 2 family protein
MRSKLNMAAIALSLVILLVMIIYANPASVLLTIGNANAFYILAALVCSLAAIFLQVVKWNVLLKGVSLSKTFPVQLLGIALNNLSPGKAAEPLKAAFLKQYTGRPVSKTLPSIIWERIFDIIVIFMFALFAIASLTQEIFIYGLIGMCVLAFLVVLLISVLFSKSVGKCVFTFLIKFPVLKRLSPEFLRSFYKTKISCYRILVSLLVSAVIWTLYGISFYFSMLSIGVSLPITLLTGIMCLSIIIGVVTSLPGGLGSTDVVMVLLLGVLSVPSATGVSGVLVSRLLSVWLGIFLGFLSFVYLSKKIDVKKLLS